MQSTSDVRVLVICPHFDDACFSTSGLLLQKTFHEVTILTVFARSRHAPNSKRLYPIIKTVNASKAFFLTGLAAKIVSRERQKEDHRFCCSIEAIQTILPFEDSSVRLPIGSPETNGEDVEKEPIYDKVLKALTKLVSSSRYDLILCPLAIGNQIDHLIVMKAILEIIKNKGISAEILFYEDLPYSSNYPLDTISKIAKERTGSSDSIIVCITDEMRMKQTLCSIYHTQWTALAKQEILYHNGRRHTSSNSKDITVGYYERFWQYNCPTSITEKK
jgi:LmbE family N-acetylglucosaminyl deacetylase